MNANFLPNQDQSFDIKRHLLTTGLILAGLVIYMQFFYKPQQPAPVAQPVASLTDTTSVAPAVAQTPATATTASAVDSALMLPPLQMSNDEVDVTLSPSTGTIDAMLLRNYLRADTPLAIPLFADFPGQGAFKSTFKGMQIPAATVAQTQKNIVCVNRQYGDFETTETFTLSDSFQIQYKVEIRHSRNAAQPLVLPDFSISTGPVQPELYLSHDKAYGTVHMITAAGEDDVIANCSCDDDESDFMQTFPAGKKYSWFATQNKYCAAIMKSETPFDSLTPSRFQRRGADGKDFWVADVAGVWTGMVIPANGVLERTATLYAGPKLLEKIEQFEPEFINAMHLSYFSWFEFLARIVLRILLWIHTSVIANYGIAIILITLAIKAAFWHLQTKATKSMRKMQTIQPQMKEIREKYADNKQLQSEKMMELYRTEGVNPVGGCLPLLLQMPIYIALFAALNGSVELRQVPFLWINDLTQPDCIATIFSFPIHPLILVQTLLMIFQQMLTPSTGDNTQKYMMYLMPVMILFFFYNMPAGLTLYMTISSIPQIIQQWIMLKHK